MLKPAIRPGVFPYTCGITPAGRRVVKPRGATDAGQGELEAKHRFGG
jgi:hypothetical protein